MGLGKWRSTADVAWIRTAPLGRSAVLRSGHTFTAEPAATRCRESTRTWLNIAYIQLHCYKSCMHWYFAVTLIAMEHPRGKYAWPRMR